MKCSLGISNFLDEISSLSHSIVLLHFFALITEKGWNWNSAFKWVYLSFSPLPFTSLLSTAICKASLDNHFAFLHLLFLGMVLIPASCKMSQTSIHSSSGTLSDLIPWTYLSLPLWIWFRLYLNGLVVFPTFFNLSLNLAVTSSWSEIQPVHPQGNQFWIFIGRTDAEAETPILWPPHAKNSHLKRTRCWERLKAGGEGDGRGWDSWTASPTQWTWVWVNSGSWWRTGRPGALQPMGSQRVGHDRSTELIDWLTFFT